MIFKDDKNVYNELESVVWDFFIKKLPRLGFESREGQEDMALDICSSIRDKQHTIVEAGVGIGKSYAYIVPLMYYNKLFNKPVVIATSTIALQEQLVKDIKNISIHIKHKPEIVLAKGMTHFACRNRAEKYFKSLSSEEVDEENTMLSKYIDIGKVDRKNINMDIDDKLWDKVNIVATEHSKCKYFRSCRFMELREQMMKTNGIIICNQDLLTVHFQKIRRGQKGLLNNDVDLVVIDEAHNLEEKVRSSLIENYSVNKIHANLSEIANNISKVDIRNDVFKVIRLIESILHKLFKKLDIQIKKQSDKGYNSEDMEKFFINVDDVKEEVTSLLDRLKYINNSAQFYGGDNLQDETVEEIENIQLFFKNLLDIKGKRLFWLEKDRNIKIYSCPKNIDMEIKNLYFDSLKTTILTSATIANRNEGSEKERYEYFIKTIGFPIDKGFLSPQKYSPFPYDTNTMLYYKNSMPHPTLERKEFIIDASKEIIKLLDITKGKALILFTSKYDLNKVYDILKDENLDYKLLKQSNSSSQDEILEKFKEDENSVLLATGTFWEGIDVPGKALSNLIVFKLPFPVPDPILDYKKNICNDFLMEVSVPIMIVKLRQGIGRLIRKNDDVGIVSILDSRIGDNSSSKYKSIVFNSLPIKNKSSNIEVIEEFWKKI